MPDFPNCPFRDLDWETRKCGPGTNQVLHIWARTALLSGWWHECVLCLVRSCIFLLERNHPFFFQRNVFFFSFLLISLQVLSMKGHHFFFFLLELGRKLLQTNDKNFMSCFTSPFSTFSPSNYHRKNKFGHHRESKKKLSIQQRIKKTQPNLLISTRILKILETSKINVCLFFIQTILVKKHSTGPRSLLQETHRSAAPETAS